MTLIEDPYCSRYFSNSSFTFAMFAFTRACKSFPHSISCPISRMHPAFRASRSFSIVYFFNVRPLPVMRARAESEVMMYRVGTTSTVGLDVPGMYSCGKGKSHNESRLTRESCMRSFAQGTLISASVAMDCAVKHWISPDAISRSSGFAPCPLTVAAPRMV